MGLPEGRELTQSEWARIAARCRTEPGFRGLARDVMDLVVTHGDVDVTDAYIMAMYKARWARQLAQWEEDIDDVA